MMAFQYETVPSLEDSWVECHGDLARYRMAIEEEEPRDREIWSGVAMYWYSKASDRNPTADTSHLCHHLAILARPYTSEQLPIFSKALTYVDPFENTRGRIRNVNNPILVDLVHYPRASVFDLLFMKAHGVLFCFPQRTIIDRWNAHENVVDTMIGWAEEVTMDARSKGYKRHWKKILTYLTISNISGIIEYGALKRDKSRGTIFSRVFMEALGGRIDLQSAPEKESPQKYGEGKGLPKSLSEDFPLRSSM